MEGHLWMSAKERERLKIFERVKRGELRKKDAAVLCGLDYLCRRIRTEFTLMFGRLFDPKEDRILWSWDWSHYGFQTSESLNAGHSKAVEEFPLQHARNSERRCILRVQP